LRRLVIVGCIACPTGAFVSVPLQTKGEGRFQGKG
jgi:hypothetical protein